MRIKRRSRILPLLQRLSGGPFNSTTVGSEGIILPSLVYKNSKLRNKKKIQKDKVKNLDDEAYKPSEILDVVKILEKSNDKFIFEEKHDRDVKSGSSVKNMNKPNQKSYSPSSSDSVASHFYPLEAAYHPSNVVPDVWICLGKEEVVIRRKELVSVWLKLGGMKLMFVRCFVTLNVRAKNVVI